MTIWSTSRPTVCEHLHTRGHKHLHRDDKGGCAGIGRRSHDRLAALVQFTRTCCWGLHVDNRLSCWQLPPDSYASAHAFAYAHHKHNHNQPNRTDDQGVALASSGGPTIGGLVVSKCVAAMVQVTRNCCWCLQVDTWLGCGTCHRTAWCVIDESQFKNKASDRFNISILTHVV